MEPALLAMLAAAVLVLGLVAALAGALARSTAGQRRLEHDLAATRAELVELRDRLDRLDRADRPSAPAPGAAADVHAVGRPDGDLPDYVITTLPDHAASGPEGPPVRDGRPSRREFASVAVTESVVKVAALAYGVRRALSPQSRNRIRFEMGREVKRSRRERRRAARQARRSGPPREPDPVLADLDARRADEAA